MKDVIKIVGIQAELIWENVDENLRRFQEKIATISDDVDLIILPEMFSTGFTMNPTKVSENMDGKTVNWMKKLAREHCAAIMGSLVIQEDNHFYNRSIFVDDLGNLSTYDKRHLFTLSGEHNQYKAGEKTSIIEYKGWRICPMICYDLRFPVWSRNTDNYDLLIYMANWPRQRIAAWDALLKARGIENMCYCIGVNRVGVDKNKYEYSGSSACYDFLGNTIAETKDFQEDVIHCSLEKSSMLETRKKLNFLNDKDTFVITN